MTCGPPLTRPTTVFTHLEPVEDPLSLDDVEIDRLIQQ